MKTLILFALLCTLPMQLEATKNGVATIYTVNPNDGKQSRTASGKIINENEPFSHRFIAISRDLLGLFEFGERVIIEGAGKFDGEYIIEDLMGFDPKTGLPWTNKIDILVNPNEPLNKFEDVLLYKIN